MKIATLPETILIEQCHKNNDDSFWMLMLSNLVQFHLIKNTADYFGLGESIKEQLKNLTKKSS